MVSVQLLTLALALSAPGETVLLDFSAPWCAPCRSMEGTVAELSRAGYPVRKVDVDRQRALADQYRVETIPCFVLLVDGREAGRVTGASRRSELLALFERAGVRPRASTGAIARAQSPDDSHALAGGPPTGGSLVPVQHPGPSDPEPSGVAAGNADPQRLIQASVRLKIEDQRGASYGTGTIVDSRQGEALVLTCGHIFRDSAGKGRITVDMCGPGAPQQLPARLVAYDAEHRDVGLVSIRPGVPVEVAPVAPKGQPFAHGERVTTVGCNNGGPATAVASQITSINKFLGAPNVQVAGAPVEGRSGGGLFNAQGQVIGVCNAADPADNEGLYAALATIHEQLDSAGLTAVYAAREPAAGPAGRLTPAMATGMPQPSFAVHDDGRARPAHRSVPVSAPHWPSYKAAMTAPK